jgi:hypothetical protein
MRGGDLTQSHQYRFVGKQAAKGVNGRRRSQAQIWRIRPAADTFHDMTEAVTLREKPIAECGDETSGARNKPGAVAGRD